MDPFTFGDDVIYVSNAPANVKATVSGSYNQVKLTWSRSIDANGYWVEYKTSSASKWSTAAYTTNLGIIKSNLNAGTTYMFKVTPYTTVSGRRYFGPAKTVTAKTLSLKVKTPTVKKASKTKVKVSWKNIAAESGYQISKSTKKSGTTIVATYKTTKGTSKKISAKKGKKYYYKVRAYKIVNGAKVYGPWTSAKAFKL